MTKALVFPGQGSQIVGMGKELYDSFAEAKHVFEEVDDALSKNLSKIIFEGPIEDLTLTENTQPALMATSIAVMRVLEKQGGKSIGDIASYVAGHSLGEYSALCAAGSVSLSDTAKLLKIRGISMQEAVPQGQGAMAAIIGLSLEDVEKIATVVDGVAEVANDNSDGQVVISGAKAAVEQAEAIAKDVGAKRFVILNVSAPFHSSLMQPAADRMAEALASAEFVAPKVPLIANVTADVVTEPQEIKDLLVKQVTGRVRWRESVAKLNELGVEATIEVGAGKVLSGLTRRIVKEMSSVSIQNAADIEKYLG